MKPKIKIITAKSAGMCGGVLRAVNIAENSAKNCPTAILGEIVHNKAVNDSLKALGAITIKQVSECPPESVLIIRSHGEAPETYREIKSYGLKFLDATCPKVKSVQKLVRNAAINGHRIIYIGDKSHPESIATIAYAREFSSFENQKEIFCFSSFEHFLESPISNAVEFCRRYTTVLFQTTTNLLNVTKFQKHCEKILTKCQNSSIIIRDTVCKSSVIRQSEAAFIADSINSELSENNAAAIGIVIGDASSSNSKKLFDIFKNKLPNALFSDGSSPKKIAEIAFLKVMSEIRTTDSFPKLIIFGITAGASVPGYVFENVVLAISDFYSSIL